MPGNIQKLQSRSKGIIWPYSVYFYNEVLTHFPSRRVRIWYLQHLLKECAVNVSVLMHIYLMNPRGISIGERTVINQHCILDGRVEQLWIGSDVDIGPHTHIWTLQHDPHATTDHGTKAGSVKIEHHAWIASRVTILPGVTIGVGAVVATGSVVTKDVPALTIVAGIPARQIGTIEREPTYKLNFYPRLR
jgi:acetyltransferase-like isoleucine patch superfamily enzyme